MAKFDIYKDTADNWRWRLLADNGRKVAASGESFSSRSGAVRAAATAKSIAAKTPVPVDASALAVAFRTGPRTKR